MNLRGIDWRQQTPILLIAALAVAATLSFGGVVSDWSFIMQAIAGAVGALAIVTLAASRRLLLGESLALSIVAFVVVGVIATALIPTPGNVAGFFSGLVNGWADLLSTSPPADLTPELRVLPFTVAWLGAMLGGEIRRASPWPGLGAVGPLAAMVVALMFSVETSLLPVVQGMAMIGGTIALALVQQYMAQERLATEDADDDAARVGNRRGLVVSALVAGAIAILAPLAGPLLPFVDAEDRFDLRQLQEAPWDALAVPSPLVGIKASLKTNRVDDVVFTVTAGQLVDRWPVAVLNSYNGVVWGVADAQVGGNAAFRPVDTAIPPIDDSPVATRSNTVEHSIVLGDIGAHWIPTAGVPTRVDADIDLRLNRRSGTIASPQVLQPGTEYSVASVLRPTVTLADLEAIEPATDPTAIELIGAPAAITNLAADITLGVAKGGPQIEAIIDTLTNSGFYDASLDAPPGHSYNRIVSFVDLDHQIRGYEEQYAAAAAVLVRATGAPARVVVGYVVAPTRRSSYPVEVRAGDIAAWIEIKTTAGWATLDVTPDRSREPSEEELGQSSQETAIADPPPPVPPPDTNPLVQDEMTDEQPEDPNEDEPDRPDPEDDLSQAEAGSGVLRVLLLAGGLVLAPLLLIGGVLAFIVWLKVRRERKRRTAPVAGHRIAGAWAELLDRLEEAGLPAVDRGTPREAVATLVSTSDGDLDGIEGDLFALTDQVDRAAFHPVPPADAHAAEAWSVVDNTVQAVLQRRTTWQRMQMLVNPRLLLRRRTDPPLQRSGDADLPGESIIDLTGADEPVPELVDA